MCNLYRGTLTDEQVRVGLMEICTTSNASHPFGCSLLESVSNGCAVGFQHMMTIGGTTVTSAFHATEIYGQLSVQPNIPQFQLVLEEFSSERFMLLFTFSFSTFFILGITIYGFSLILRFVSSGGTKI